MSGGGRDTYCLYNYWPGEGAGRVLEMLTYDLWASCLGGILFFFNIINMDLFFSIIQ